MRALTAHTALINTAAVEIKTLTVSGKQVTLALFRQLIEQPIFDPTTGQLLGVGWGHVRYLLPDQANPDQTINLVWQQGDQLRRCILHRQPHPWLTSEQAAKFLDNPFEYRSYPYAPYIPRMLSTPWAHLSIDSSIPDEFKPPYYSENDQVAKLRSTKAVNQYTEMVRNNFRPKIAHAMLIYAAYDRCVPPLFDLPQLFIAV